MHVANLGLGATIANW